VNLSWKISYCGGFIANHKRKCQESCLTSAVVLDLALLLELNTEDSLKNDEGRRMNEKKMMISFFSLMKFILLLVQVEQPDLWMPLHV
jgi:hypothetical protein